MKTIWISFISLILIANSCTCESDEVEIQSLDDTIERGKRSSNTDQPPVAKETNGDLSDETFDKRNLGRWRNYRHIVAERGKRYLNRWLNQNHWLYLNRKSKPEEKRGLALDLFQDHYDNVHSSPNDYVLSKRNFGRWKNRNYALSYALKRSQEGDILDRMHLGNSGDFDQNYLGDGAILRLPDTLGEFGSLKRNVGRWRNWAHRFGVSKRSVTQSEDESLPRVDVQDFLDGLRTGAEKRNIGRWRNRNYMRQKKPILIDSVASKRFLGRWKNRNFQVKTDKGE